jgi:hypothetical protein
MKEAQQINTTQRTINYERRSQEVALRVENHTPGAAMSQV